MKQLRMIGRAALLVATLVAVGACSQAAPPAVTQPTAAPAAAAQPALATDTSAETTSPRGFIEPPFLAERVASGELPPIDERLPAEVFRVGPGVLLQEQYMTWEDGQYGGDINIAATFPTGFVNIAGGATILRSPSQTSAASLPNVVSAFSHAEDYTTFTFTIREGLRWSDGQPVTTEDVRFTFEDLYNDPDVQRPWPTPLFAQGNAAYGPAELTISDAYSFQLTFSQPYGSFIADLNSWIPYYDFLIKPAHYLKQFHATYADADELAATLEASGEPSWVQLLNSRDVLHWDLGEERALGMPVLNAWVLAEVGESRRVFERNPYFWHVDTSGRQLPYVDRIVNNMVIDPDAEANALLAGQISLATGGQTALNRMPIYTQNAEKIGVKIFTTGSFNYPISLFLNHDYAYDVEGSVWQELITDPEHRFGAAVAAAMDPADVNTSVFFDLFGAPFLNNTGRDLEQANQLLDAVGMAERGADGFRLGPDGQPFVLRITFSAFSADVAPVAELLKEQIEEAGIHVELESVDGALFDQRKAANEIQASLFFNDGPAWPTGISEDYLPAAKGPWSPMTWLHFTSNGEEGREPPAYIQEFYDLHVARKEFPPESAEGQAIFSEMLQWMSDNYAFIPTSGLRIHPNVVDARLRNVPNDGAPFELDTYINAEAVWFAER